MSVDYIGFIAAFLTTVATLPQLINIIKSKNVEGVSLSMFSTLGVGVFLWLVYGLFKNDTPLIVANTITFVLVLSNIFFILKFRIKTLENRNNS